MFRPLEGLKFAVESKCPWGRARPRGAKAAGLRYEKAFARAMPQAKHNPWFAFIDRNGAGNCSPDFVLELDDCLVVFECKLSDKSYAKDQLRLLYVPIVERVYGKSVRAIVVTKILRPWSDTSRVVGTMAEAIEMAKHTIPTLHWLGRGKLL